MHIALNRNTFWHLRDLDTKNFIISLTPEKPFDKIDFDNLPAYLQKIVHDGLRYREIKKIEETEEVKPKTYQDKKEKIDKLINEILDSGIKDIPNLVSKALNPNLACTKIEFMNQLIITEKENKNRKTVLTFLEKTNENIGGLMGPIEETEEEEITIN